MVQSLKVIFFYFDHSFCFNSEQAGFSFHGKRIPLFQRVGILIPPVFCCAFGPSDLGEKVQRILHDGYNMIIIRNWDLTGPRELKLEGTPRLQCVLCKFYAALSTFHQRFVDQRVKNLLRTIRNLH